MFNIVKKTFAYGAHQVTLETGEIARQASGAVMVSIDDTVVLDAPDQEFPELIVRDLKTKKDVTVSKDLASFEYVGRVWQP